MLIPSIVRIVEMVPAVLIAHLSARGIALDRLNGLVQALAPSTLVSPPNDSLPSAHLLEDLITVVRVPWYADFSPAGNLMRLKNDYYIDKVGGNPVSRSLIVQRADRLMPYIGNDVRRVGLALVEGKWQVRMHPFIDGIPVWSRYFASFDASSGELIEVYAPRVRSKLARVPMPWISHRQAVESLLGHFHRAYIRIDGLERGYLPSLATGYPEVYPALRQVIRIHATSQDGRTLQELQAIVDGETGALLALVTGRKGESKADAPKARKGTKGTLVAKDHAWEGVYEYEAPLFGRQREYGWLAVGNEAFQVDAPPVVPEGSRTIAETRINLDLTRNLDWDYGQAPWPGRG